MLLYCGVINKIMFRHYYTEVRESNLGGCEIFRTCPDRPGAYPASYTVGTGDKAAVAWR